MKLKINHFIHEVQSKSTDPVCAYVYDLVGMQTHVRNMLKTMPKQTHLFYALKANPDKKVIQALLPLVEGFEVASMGELIKVREVSKTVPILFGGPGKKDAELELALKENVTYLHVESLLELQKIMMIASKRKQHIDILLRINLRTKTLPKTNISMGGRPSQFGLDEQLIDQAVSLLKQENNTHVHLSGFHFHSLSNNTDAKLHVKMIDHYFQKVKQWQHMYGLNIKVINAGGGFGVSYDGTPGFDWQLFIALLAESETVQNIGDSKLFFEPGRFIVADYGYYAAEVIDLKMSAGQCFAVLRGGTHHNRLPASWGHNHPFSVFQTHSWSYPFARPEINNTNVTIVGELCTPKDRLHEHAKVERLRTGDVVIFEKSGAYCWTISHHDFLGHPHPNFYYLMEGSHYE